MRAKLIKESLLKLAEDEKLKHAYILECRKSDDLEGFVRQLAREITPYREDIHSISADGLSIRDKAVEGLLERLRLKPLVGERTVAVINDGHTMTHRAQNRLLKTLEEPPGNDVILILTTNVEHLLPTVRSRCVLFRLDEESEEGQVCNGLSRDDIYSVGAMILEGKNYYAIAGKLKEIVKDRDQSYDFLDSIEMWYRNLLLSALGFQKACRSLVMEGSEPLLTKERAFRDISLIEEARRELDSRINTGYAIKNMILKMIREESI
jgi:hypothetical protein